jgi:hypothetical protein
VRITWYTNGIRIYEHSVTYTNDGIAALMAAADDFLDPGFLVPMHNTELLRRCLDTGMRLSLMMSLMTIGLGQEPRGAFLASVGC